MVTEAFHRTLSYRHGNATGNLGTYLFERKRDAREQKAKLGFALGVKSFLFEVWFRSSKRSSVYGLWFVDWPCECSYVLCQVLLHTSDQ